MINIALIDDNAKDLRDTADLVVRAMGNSGEGCAVKQFTDALSFINRFKNDYDIVILDIAMPVMDGMTIAKKIRGMQSDCEIIFVTNMLQFALEGYKVEAAGYFVKPVNYFQVNDVLTKCVHRISKRHKECKRIVVSTGSQVKNIYSNEIFYIEVQNHNIIYHTTDGDYETRKTLGEVSELLMDVGFVRCNHCYLVNLKYVECIHGNTVTVNGNDLMISRNRKKDFINAFMRYTR